MWAWRDRSIADLYLLFRLSFWLPILFNLRGAGQDHRNKKRAKHYSQQERLPYLEAPAKEKKPWISKALMLPEATQCYLEAASSNGNILGGHGSKATEGYLRLLSKMREHLTRLPQTIRVLNIPSVLNELQILVMR